MTNALPVFTRSNYVLATSCAAVLIAATAIIGWAADVAILRSVLPGFPPMHPLTAAAFIALSAGLASTLLRYDNRLSNLLPIAAGLAVSLGSLTGIAARLNFSIGSAGQDALRKAAASGAVVEQSIPSPNTPFILLLLGLSLIFLRTSSREKWFSEILAAAAVVATFAAGLGHIYRAEAPFLMSGSQGAALGSELLFVLLSFAMIVRNPRSRLLQLFGSDSLGGTAARRLIPAVVIIPTLIGWLQVRGIESGMFDPGLGAATSTFTLVMLMLALVFFYSRAVHASDRQSRKVQAELADKETRYRLLVDHGQGSISTHDLDGKLLSINPAGGRVLGYEEHEIVGQNLRNFIPSSRHLEYDAYLRQIKYEGIADGIFTMKAKNGRMLTFRFHNVLVSDDGMEPYVLSHSQDVTDLLEAQRELKNLSLTDDLTGLYNRRGFLTMAEQQFKLEMHNGTARGLSLLFADMDGLKKINDTFGHEAGSRAIVALSRLIKSVVRGADLVARWGGDEFVVLTIGANDENCDQMIERIYECIDEHNAESREPYLIACSIGIATVDPGRQVTFDEIIAQADAAMYTEKKIRKVARGDAPDPSEAPHLPEKPWTGDSSRI